MKRYTDTISDELKDKVTRIQAQNVSDFRSCAFEVLEGMDEDMPVCRWRRAYKDEETNIWSVVEYQTAPYLQQDADTSASHPEDRYAGRTAHPDAQGLLSGCPACLRLL